MQTQQECVEENYTALRSEAIPSRRDKVVEQKVKLMLELLALRDRARAETYILDEQHETPKPPEFYPTQRVSYMGIMDWAALQDIETQRARKREWELARRKGESEGQLAVD